MAYIFDPIRNTFVDDEDTSLGNKLALNDNDELDKAIRQLDEQFGPGTVQEGTESIPTPPKTIERDMFKNAFKESAADGGMIGRINFGNGGSFRNADGSYKPINFAGKKISFPNNWRASDDLKYTYGQVEASIRNDSKKLNKWLKNPTPQNWIKLGLSKSQFARNLRAYLLDQPIDPRKGTGLDKASKELFDQINIKKLFKPSDINKINELTTGGKGKSLKSIAAKTFGNLKYTMPEVIDTIKNFQNGEQWLKKNPNPDAVDLDGKNIYRKYANAIKGMQSEQSRIGGFPFGNNSEKKLWSNLYRASYRGNRIKIVGEFADGNLPINKQGKVDWKMVDKNGVPAWKRVKFIDLEAPKKTTFTWGENFKNGDLAKQIDNTFGKGFFRKSTAAYDTQIKTGSKRDFTTAGGGKTIKNNVKVQLLTTEALAENPNATKKQIDAYIKRKAPRFNLTEVHHPDGVGKNPYKTEPVFRYANREVGKVESALKAGKITQAEAKIRIDTINNEIGPVRIKLDDGYYGNYKNTQKSILESSNKYINALKSGALKGLKIAGKVIKPIGYAVGTNAVIQAKGIADEMNIELKPQDLFMALDSGDANTAIDNYKRRNVEGYSEEQNAITLSKLKDDFEEVGLDEVKPDETLNQFLADGGRVGFNGGGAVGADDDFAKELEYFLLNPDAELPKADSYRETMNPVALLNDMIDPRNYAYYADRLAETGIRIGEFGARVLPALGQLTADLIRKPAFKVTGGTGQGYVQDYTDVMPSNIKGTGIFTEFLDNLVGTEGTKVITEKIGLDKLIKSEEQKQKDRRSTAGPKILADQVTLGAELTAPIFPGLKLLKAYAKNRKLPVNDTTRQVMEKEIDEVLEAQNLNRRDFLKVTGAGGAVILAKMLGFGDELATTTKVVEKATKETVATGGVPPYFLNLVKKIKTMGDETMATKDKATAYKYDDYYMEEDFAGNIEITRKGDMDVPGYEEVYMSYRVDEVPIKGEGGSRKVEEYEEFTARPDEDGKMKDVEDGVPDDVIEEGTLFEDNMTDFNK